MIAFVKTMGSLVSNVLSIKETRT